MKSLFYLPNFAPSFVLVISSCSSILQCMAEPAFVPKPGQVDFTHIRYAPVVNLILVHDDKLLLVQRSADLRFYPNYWHCIAGFLDDNQSIEEKAYEELREELGVTSEAVESMERGAVILTEAPQYNKTYLVVPLLVKIKATEFHLDWEATQAKWFTPAQAKKADLLPGFIKVLDQLFPT